ncbi:MAG: UDP-N-acetylenolpyruvoylglucosamine reductase [Turneriella sp.]|nr:UDP-N-acetylenolpyruvoylglucosamine reductase [Turneriella sp.]
MVLGGGSNILFCADYNGTILKNEINTLRFDTHEDTALIKAGGGVIWHTLVEECVQKGYTGLENLALIPGTVGAAPIQNIGAYGVEVKDAIVSVRGYSTRTSAFETFENNECAFGYRTSIFKEKFKNEFIITEVTLRVSKKESPNTSYGALQEHLTSAGIKKPSCKDVFDAVCAIRREKLPNPKIMGNAGSFFKNPVIEKEKYESLIKTFPNLPHYAFGDKYVKIPAAYLIDSLGFKGVKRFDANGAQFGVHTRQPLVLVNYGGATGASILTLAEEIQKAVLEKFRIHLEKEVCVVRG